MTKPFNNNPRQLKAKRAAELRASLDELGDISGILHDLDSDSIVCGNQRVNVTGTLQSAFGKSLAELLADGTIKPAIKNEKADVQGTVIMGVIITPAGPMSYRAFSGWSEAQKKAANLRGNVGAGEWDWEVFANAWTAEEMSEGWVTDDRATEWRRDSACFVEMQSAEETVPADAEPETDRAEELKEKWKTERGQLWRLGDHLLLCGDSTVREDVEKVMQGEKADLGFHDPPYGVKRDKGFGGGGRGFGGHGERINVREYDDEWDSERPTQETLSLLLEFCVNSIFWGGNFLADILPQSTHWLVWDKNQTMPTFGDCELAWTSFERKSVKKYEVEYNGLIGREKERFHPTQKPLKLYAAVLSDYAEEGDIVFDAYAGSGTTLLACEAIGAMARAIERDEKYVAVCLERMAQAFPNLPIEKVSELKTNRPSQST